MIDIFIFGLKDDDTAAILEIIYKDYPLFSIIFACIIYTLVVLYIAKKILNFRFTKPIKTSILIAINLVYIVVLIIGARGGLDKFPFDKESYQITQDNTINALATNPIINTAWAIEAYKNRANFYPINLSDFNSEDKSHIFRTNIPLFNTPQKPHIVVNLMESFGSNMLYFDDKDKLDLLGDFRSHFEAGKIESNNKSDFTFLGFLSSTNGTAGSFASLFLDSTASIATSKYKNKVLPLSPIQVYKNNGYRVVYVTTGKQGWQSFGDYLKAQGVDLVLDNSYILKHFKESKIDENAYGVPDEYNYKVALDLLKNATQPTLILILTTSNHPPIKIPHNFIPPQYDIDESLKSIITNKNKINEIIGVFTYSNDAFGKFISEVKTNNLNAIVAATGDHRLRDFSSVPYTHLALNTSVPLYMYIQPHLSKNLNFNPHIIGGHKDIFPTLYALSLPKVEYINVGGRNLFAPDSLYNFASNGVVIDKEAIYQNNLAYKYKWQNGFIIPIDKGLPLNDNQQRNLEFINYLEQLNKKQINYKIFATE